MSIEIGKKYYFMVHAYHHYIGEVVEITGKKEAVLKNVVRVQSSTLNWTQFWIEGCDNRSTYTIWPDGTEVSQWFCVVPWKHDIPRK